MAKKLTMGETAQGYPSPLFISCWNKSTEVTEYLLQKIHPSLINDTGPDGMTPLMVLLKLGKYKVVEQHLAKFGIKEVITQSLSSSVLDLFEKAMLLGKNDSSLSSPLTMAGKLNDQKALLRTKAVMDNVAFESVGDQMSYDYSHAMMHIETGTVCLEGESYLTKLTRQFPVYNEDVERKYNLKLPRKFPGVYIKEILAHALDPFCCFLSESRSTRHVMKIKDLDLSNSFSCPKGKHTR